MSLTCRQIIGIVLVAAAAISNGLSTGFLFASDPWWEAMGIYWMFVLLGCISVAINLMAIPMLIWGKTWRQSSDNLAKRLAHRQFGRRE